MRSNNLTSVFAMTLLILATGAFAISTPGQDREHQPQAGQKTGKDFTVGKKGEVHFNVEVKAGDAVLKPGMYQVQHIMEGSDHVIVFREMEMAAGYKMGNTPVGKEVARVKCKVESVATKVNNTRITLRASAGGQKEIAEVQVVGEAFKHLM